MEHCQPFYEVFPEVFWYNMMTLLRHIYIVIEMPYHGTKNISHPGGAPGYSEF